MMVRIKFIENRIEGWAGKVHALKAIRDALDLSLKESKDWYEMVLTNGDWVNLNITDNQLAVLRDKIDLEVQYDESENDYTPQDYTPEQEDAINWYNGLDAFTQVMVDNYVSTLRFAPVG